MRDILKSISLAAILALAGPAVAQDVTGTETGAATETGTGADAGGKTAPNGTAGTPAGEDPEAQAPEGEPTAPSGTEGLNMGQPADEGDAPGRSYSAGTFGDWEQRCVRTEDGEDPCQLYQLLRDANGNAVAEISIFPLPPGREAVAGSTIITPLETLLTRAVTLAVDGGRAKRYPFDFCVQQGCFARVGFTQGEIDQFKRGAAAKMTIVPAAAPDQQIDLTISLSGFTAGYEAVREANAPE